MHDYQGLQASDNIYELDSFVIIMGDSKQWGVTFVYGSKLFGVLCCYINCGFVSLIMTKNCIVCYFSSINVYATLNSE